MRNVYSVLVEGFTNPAQRTPKVLSTLMMEPGAFCAGMREYCEVASGAVHPW